MSRVRRTLLPHERFQPRDHLRDRWWRGAAAVREDNLLEQLRAIDERFEARAREHHVPFADDTQAAFHVMREALDLAQLDHRRDALQRMKASEEIVEDARRHVGAERGFERQQSSPRGDDVLLGFSEVVIHEARGERSMLIRRHGVTSRATTRQADP